MGSNGDLNANSQCISSTGDLVLDKAVSQWMAWDKVRMQLHHTVIRTGRRFVKFFHIVQMLFVFVRRCMHFLLGHLLINVIHFRVI